MTTRVLRPNVLSALEALRNDPELQPINDPPLRKVASIQFGILSEEEILAMSVCHVTVMLLLEIRSFRSFPLSFVCFQSFVPPRVVYHSIYLLVCQVKSIVGIKNLGD